MSKQPTYKFTSRKNNELTLSNRWDRDTRSVYEDRDPTELRQGDKIQGRGQILDFFEVSDACACCGTVSPLNIVSLCGTCASTLAKGGMIGDRAEKGARQRRRTITVERVALALAQSPLFPWQGTKSAPQGRLI